MFNISFRHHLFFSSWYSTKFRTPPQSLLGLSIFTTNIPKIRIRSYNMPTTSSNTALRGIWKLSVTSSSRQRMPFLVSSIWAKFIFRHTGGMVKNINFSYICNTLETMLPKFYSRNKSQNVLYVKFLRKNITIFATATNKNTIRFY